MKCSCGKMPLAGDLFCRNCGAEMYYNDVYLCECGSEVMNGDKYCHSCGARLSEVKGTCKCGAYIPEGKTLCSKCEQTDLRLFRNKS